MAGLDTRGAFDGFVKGFGMMQGYQDSKDRKAYMKEQQAMQQRGLEMREQEFAGRQEDRQSQKDQQQIAQFYNGWSNGIEAPITPELEKAFERNKLSDPRHLFKPETEAAIQYADKLSSGEGSLFSQDTVDAMNNFYAPRVSRGDGGKKRLAGIYPGQKDGSFVFELEIEDEQGQKRLAPMTVNRGVAGLDDEVAQYDIDQAIGPVMGAKSIYQALGDNREKMMGYLRSSGFLPQEEAGWEEVKGPGGSILQRNTKTGELKNVLGRAPQQGGSSGGGAYGSPTSQQKNFLFLRDALKLTDEEAYKVAFGGTGAVNEKVSDRVSKGISYLSTQIKEIDSIISSKGMMIEEAELESLQIQRQELAEQRDVLARSAQLYNAPEGMPQLGQPQQPQQAQPAQQQGAQQSQVDDEIRKLNLW